VALPVRAESPDGGAQEAGGARLAATGVEVPRPLLDEITEFLTDVEHRGAAGSVHLLPRPGREPSHVLLVGIGDGDEAGWRAAGAALARAAAVRLKALTVQLPLDAAETAARGLAEGAWLAAYRFRLASEPGGGPRLRRITLAGGDATAVSGAVAWARAVAGAVVLARDLTNTPSLQKSPKWFADRVAHAAARRSGVAVSVLDAKALAERGFGGILAVGGGSARPPYLVELSWRPRRPRAHVVLVGKGITFDTGGISIKPAAFMRLMRKDMGGGAAVCAALLAAADLNLPVRVTALVPLAENMVSGSAFRPGDVVRHYSGMTTEVRNTDAEGRVVLADALAYAARRFRADVLVDLATLTGASHVALGKRTAALFSEDDALAAALTAAGTEAGEPMWRLPLADEYMTMLASDVADLNNSPTGAEAGTVTAALYLREFTGNLRDRWAHIDMSAPSWIDSNDGPLVKGATGWGVRMLLRWLAAMS
jgi:leucyl aminopeptidase